jgi:hypothetical protein
MDDHYIKWKECGVPHPILPPSTMSSQQKRAVASGSSAAKSRKSKTVKSAAIVASDHEGEGSSDGEGGMDVEEVGGVDALDVGAAEAVISVNRINLIDVDVTLRFGMWNRRPLVENRVLDLRKTMKSQNFRPFRPANLIPLIISRDALDPECVNPSYTNVHSAPLLKLSSTNPPSEILVAGGQHRYHAVKGAVKEADETIARLKETLEREAGKELKGEEAREKRVERIREIESRIKQQETFRNSIKYWGVVVYDMGECRLRCGAFLTLFCADLMRANGEQLARHISRNEVIKHFPEDDREELVMQLHEFLARSRPGASQAELESWLRKLGADSKKSALGQIMNHRETRAFLITLDEFGDFFHYDPVFSLRWVKSNIHNVGGGVSVISSNHFLRFDNCSDYHPHCGVPRPHLADNVVASGFF